MIGSSDTRRAGLRRAGVLRGWAAVLAALVGVLVAGQAFAVATLVADLLAAPDSGRWHTAAWWLLGIAVAKALVGAYGDLMSNAEAWSLYTRITTSGMSS